MNKDYTGGYNDGYVAAATVTDTEKIQMLTDALRNITEREIQNRERIAKALEFIVKYGSIDGAHHKDWVLDQVVRTLTGCPMVEKTATDCNGKPYTYQTQGESQDYLNLVKEACAGEDGPDTYSWSEGVPP